MQISPNPQPATNWKRIYLFVLLFNALLIAAFYLLSIQFNIG